MMKEDDLKEGLIQRWKNGEEIKGEKALKTEPEAHYSYYGKRGVADLFVLRGHPKQDPEFIHGAVYEIKTKLTEPHEIMRQFNRMVYAFFEDENRPEPLSAVFELTVAPTQHNFKHLIEYQHIYDSIWFERELHHKPEEADNFEKYLQIKIRHPDNLDPVDWREVWEVVKSGRNLNEWLERNNPEIAEEIDF
jgi:hypothetical protein